MLSYISSFLEHPFHQMGENRVLGFIIISIQTSVPLCLCVKISAHWQVSTAVFRFIDIAAYKKVVANLERGGIKAREFQPGEMEEIAGRIGGLAKGWGIWTGTCGEIRDLDRFGIEHNRCVDDRLIVKCFSPGYNICLNAVVFPGAHLI